jgi:hypothetical protein
MQFLYGSSLNDGVLTTILQHGGGKVVSNIKALDPKKNATRSCICLVAAEEPCKVPDSLRHLITCLELPLMVCLAALKCFSSSSSEW